MIENPNFLQVRLIWDIDHALFEYLHREKELKQISLEEIGKADWERLERITIAVDDRDVELCQEKDKECKVSVFHFATFDLILINALCRLRC